MLTVHKYPFRVLDRVVLMMPEGAEVLHVEYQHGRPCLWALVDTERILVTHHFRIFGTGEEVPVSARDHVATFQEGLFVWHLFWDGEEP
jgi:hypothetical protein